MRSPKTARAVSHRLFPPLAFILFGIGSSNLFAQTESVVYHFRSGSDGSNPRATMIADSAGNLYGTTALGGGSLACGSTLQTVIGCGTLFEITSQGGHLIETVLYSFTNGTDGGQPYGGLVFDQAGNLYGTTTTGGAHQAGTVFQLMKPASVGGSWTLNVIYSLTASNNGFPVYPVIDRSGNVYFEEPEGGSDGIGAVSELSPPSSQGAAWTYSQLYSFPDWNHGSLPLGALTFDRSGNLYGATSRAGYLDRCTAVMARYTN